MGNGWMLCDHPSCSIEIVGNLAMLSTWPQTLLRTVDIVITSLDAISVEKECVLCKGVILIIASDISLAFVSARYDYSMPPQTLFKLVLRCP